MTKAPARWVFTKAWLLPLHPEVTGCGEFFAALYCYGTLMQENFKLKLLHTCRNGSQLRLLSMPKARGCILSPQINAPTQSQLGKPNKDAK